MNNAEKNSLRKFSFLGFQKPSTKNDGSSNVPEVQLDEECAKVFAMDTDSIGFDFHDPPFSGQPKFGEKDYIPYCKCGSKLTCDIQKCSDFNDYIVNCQIVNGIGKCGKPYLRNPIRKELGERMYGQHVEAFRSEQANEMMSRDGDPEAPMIRSASVLYNVKKEHLQQQYIRPNPLEALKILKYGELVNCIEDIGFDPFFVQYSTNDALQSYKKLCAKQTKTCVCIDSTAGVVKKLDTKTIFLHALAVGVPEGQFSVTHMLSEISHTQAICNWLKMWRRSGAPVPDACVTDWSKALLNGTTNAFTTFETVENYADSLNKRDLRTCKIFLRIDVAHTMKKYSQFFKTLRKPIKTFYLACIGQLIKCSSKLEARTIIENLLIVCQSETDGHLRGGNATACEDGRRVLMELITTEVDSIITEESESVSNIQETIEPISNLCKNSWSSWFDDIQSSVKELIAHQEGDRLNAYYFVPLVAYLLKDIPLLPLWTNIVANDLGFGGVNPSSAAIEQVFRKIKNDIFTTDELPMRVDMFVQKHTRYLLGKLKLVIAQMGIVDIADVNKIHVGDTESSKCEKSFLGNGNGSSRSNLDYECENSNCPACRIDGLASGSHHCVMCTKAVHALDQCSIPYNEDGYSQQRVCFLCWENKDFSNNIALRDFDNWGNMGVINKKIDEKRKRKTSGEENKKSKRSLYLGEKKSVIKDIINIPKHKKIPIIKNGNDKTLCPIKLENKNVFLKNTCAFDSIFQLKLAAIHDYEELDQIVSHQEEQNSFYELLKHVKDHGLGSHNYQLRGRLLGALYKILESPIIPGAYYVYCEDNVGSTARQIFSDNHFSYTEVTICNNGCEVLKKSYVTYDVPITHLIKYKIEEIITKYTKLMRNGKCNNENCLGDTVTEQYLEHRQNYPHMHAPLKIGSKSMKRRSSQQPNANPASLDPPLESISKSPTLELSAPNSSPSSSNKPKETFPDAGHPKQPAAEESNSSESECVLSDPCSYAVHDFDEKFSPERKVSFLNEKTDDFDVNGLKEKKKKRHHHGHHSKFRKYSLPDVPQKKRHHSERTDGTNFSKARRISTQPEDQGLSPNDRDQLDSHRSDDPRAFRRHKTSRPSNASLMHIGKGSELHPCLKKLYDHSPHAIFVELAEISTTEARDEREWKETARWIKYEEDVEEGVDRWGKPHVASLSFHSLLNLRRCLEEGLVILDMEERDLPAIAYRISEDLYKEDLIKEEDKAKIMRCLLLRHRHVNDHQDRGFRFTNKKQSYTSLQNLFDEEKRKGSLVRDGAMKNGDPVHDALLKTSENHAVIDMKDEAHFSTEDIRKAHNDSILRKIPVGAQASIVLVGEVDFLEQPAITFIRLAEGIIIPSLIEVNIPVRFLFLLLGPKLPNIDYHEVGRSISTLMANQQFHSIAYKADTRKELLSAINEFLDDSIVLPPGDWERQALLPIEEIKAKSEAIRRRKQNALKKAQEARGIITKPLISQGDDQKPPYDPLERTRRPLGGLINDLKRRYPHYKSDILDGLNLQCVAATIFMYFAAVSGAIAFGGLTGDKTENLIGISETLLCTSFAGIIFAMLAGQPLVIVGTTGALLLFDESLFQFSKSSGVDFLSTRVYISIWLAIIGVGVATFEGSVLVKLFTRFTEDIFSTLIVLIYIMESIIKVCVFYMQHPLLANYCVAQSIMMKNESLLDGSNDTTVEDNATDVMVASTNVKILMEDDMGTLTNQPNTALFCTVLTLGTFAIAYYLRMFRNSQFLGRSARRALGDFGVPIAIVIMVFVDYMVPQTYTEKLNVPEGLTPSDTEKRGWLISPAGVPIWIMFASAIPAMLVYILLFMETHISELIISKPERKLKKGSGLHSDIVIICLINIICGFFGFPWICAAAVRSIVHTSALTVMSRTHAPGEKPHLIEVKEQRVSALFVSIFIGLSVFMSPLLRLVPMAVVLGIFLYMGVASIDGIQFFDRTKLLFMPAKHHPQASYVRKVRTVKMHLFTFIQLICLVALWIIKSTKASLAFPFFLILLVPLRSQLKYLFSQRELRALDGDQADVDDEEPDFYAQAPLPG